MEELQANLTGKQMEMDRLAAALQEQGAATQRRASLTGGEAAADLAAELMAARENARELQASALGLKAWL